MTDLTAPAVTDDDRKLAREWAEGIAHDMDNWGDGIRTVARVVLDAVPTPPRPTLADMTEEERAACQWMQADIIGGDEPLVIAHIERSDGTALILDRNGRYDEVPAGAVTPRTDLPRMTWPGDTPALAAPALPHGWRLADHPEHGRVIVTTQTPNRDGHVYAVIPSADPLGYDWLSCGHDELTYIDQENPND